MESTKDEVDRISRLSPQQAKFLFLKTLDPIMTDAEAARRSGYKRGSASAMVKVNIRGVLGEHLAERGITMDTIAEKLHECLNARKKKVIFENQFNNKGRVMGQTHEIVDLGPDAMAVLKATQTLVVVAAKAEKDRPPELPAPIESEMSKEEAEALTGRGPRVVEDADYEEVNVETG